MGIKSSRHATEYVEKSDIDRIKRADCRSTNESKEARTQRRADRSELESYAEEVEGLLYGPGIDNYWYIIKKINFTRRKCI